MPRPIVIGHHIMWTLYGWWLPNDLRGSTSQVIRSDLFAELGELHYGRKRLQPAGQDLCEFYEQASALLQFPLLRFNTSELSAVGEVIGAAVAR